MQHTRNEKGHSLEGVWYIASREPSDPPLPDRNYLAFIFTQRHESYNNTVLFSGFSGFPFGAADANWESLGQSNQCGSKTSQASYGHPRCSLTLIRLFRLFLPLPVFGRIFLFPYPRGHKPTYSPFSTLSCTKLHSLVRRCFSPP